MQLFFFQHYYLKTAKLNNLLAKLLRSSHRHVILTNFLQKSPIWEAYSGLAAKESPCFTWNPKVDYYVHKDRHRNASKARWIQSESLLHPSNRKYFSRAVCPLRFPTNSVRPGLDWIQINSMWENYTKFVGRFNSALLWLISKATSSFQMNF